MLNILKGRFSNDEIEIFKFCRMILFLKVLLIFSAREEIDYDSSWIIRPHEMHELGHLAFWRMWRFRNYKNVGLTLSFVTD